MHWIDEKGCFEYRGKDGHKTLTHGDAIPEDIPEETLSRLLKNGQIGEVIDKPDASLQKRLEKALSDSAKYRLALKKITDLKPAKAVQAVLDEVNGDG